MPPPAPLRSSRSSGRPSASRSASHGSRSSRAGRRSKSPRAGDAPSNDAWVHISIRQSRGSHFPYHRPMAAVRDARKALNRALKEQPSRESAEEGAASLDSEDAKGKFRKGKRQRDRDKKKQIPPDQAADVRPRVELRPAPPWTKGRGKTKSKGKKGRAGGRGKGNRQARSLQLQGL